MITGFFDRVRRNISYLKEVVIGEEFFTGRGNQVLQAFLSDVHSPTLGGYYLNLRRMVTHYHLWPSMTALDENGVPQSDYSPWGLTDVGIRYHPINVAQYAMGNFQIYLETDEERYKTAFFAQIDWLMNNMKTTPTGSGVWEYDYNFLPDRYDLPIPWISAMAQGQIMSALLRAHQLTQDDKYTDAASKALQAFYNSIFDGGVIWMDDDGFTFFEEFPSRPPCHVLNGHILAMFGVYDFYRVTGSQEAYDLFYAGIATVKRYLPEYDTGFWTKYDLTRKPGLAVVRYHRIHIELMKVLYQITQEKIFDDYSRRWKSYLRSWSRIRFAWDALLERISEYHENRRGRLQDSSLGPENSGE